jgi:hypothetical protein
VESVGERDPQSRKFLETVSRDISDRGYHFIFVGAGDGDPPFSYSVGLSKTWQHPELLIVGLNMDDSETILTTFVSLIRQGHRYAHGDIDRSQFNSPIAFVEIPSDVDDSDVLSDRFAVARALYDDVKFDALQVVTPDDNGRFPWEAACDQNVVSRQPLLGQSPA